MPSSPPSPKLPSWLGPGLVAGACVALLLLERRRPLRRETESHLRRDLRNLAVAAASALTLRLLQKPVVEPLARQVAERRLGLLQQLRLPGWIELPLAVALMDYTLYLWHVLTHRMPFLWRFHRVHHIDRDLSASTALRFHFAEMAMSVPWRVAQVRLLGIGPRALAVWQTALLVSILFHHSNLRLPKQVEKRLVRFVVTPRMHGIHHSRLHDETDANWSSGLTLWDALHGTLRLDVPQRAITIGSPDYPGSAPVTLGRMLALPFRDGKSPASPQAVPGSSFTFIQPGLRRSN